MPLNKEAIKLIILLGKVPAISVPYLVKLVSKLFLNSPKSKPFSLNLKNKSFIQLVILSIKLGIKPTNSLTSSYTVGTNI